MKRVCADLDEGELALLRSILEGDGIRFAVMNESLSMLPAGLTGQKAVLVEDGDEEKVREAIAAVISRSRGG